MSEQKEIIGRIVSGTATNADRERLQHIGAELVKAMIRPRLNVLRPKVGRGLK